MGVRKKWVIPLPVCVFDRFEADFGAGDSDTISSSSVALIEAGSGG